MTRLEYENKKLELTTKRNELNRQIDELCKEFHTEETAALNNKYAGKYIVSYSRDENDMPVTNKFTIYYVEKVNFQGNGFISTKGNVVIVDTQMDDDGFLSCATTVFNDSSCSIYRIDEVLNNKQVQAKMKIVKDFNDSIFNRIEKVF